MLRTPAAALALLLSIVVGTSALAAKPKKKPKKPKPPPAATAAPTSLPPPPPPPPSSEPTPPPPSSTSGASGSASAGADVSGGASSDDESGGSKGSSGSDSGSSDATSAGYITVGALIGGGFVVGSSPNYYGLGLGIRGGYTLPMKLYLGGTFIYHLGSSAVVFANIEQKQNLYYPGVEAGYDLTFGDIMLRPYVGLGIAIATGSIGNQSDTTSNFAVWPGVLATYSFGKLFVGADARFVLPTGLGSNAVSLFATVGARF